MHNIYLIDRVIAAARFMIIPEHMLYVLFIPVTGNIATILLIPLEHIITVRRCIGRRPAGISAIDKPVDVACTKVIGLYCDL